ncbi:MAG TPA: hypothetical protein VF677_01350 [Flavobacterium sp.]|jgi:hypothetical protein
MNIEELKNAIESKLSNRDYFGMFELIDKKSEDFLKSSENDYYLAIELITQNQDLLEYMGASKQFEMAFDLLNKLTKNRNRLFLHCINKNQKELKLIFKRCVGDFSSEY